MFVNVLFNCCCFCCFLCGYFVYLFVGGGVLFVYGLFSFLFLLLFVYLWKYLRELMIIGSLKALLYLN